MVSMAANLVSKRVSFARVPGSDMVGDRYHRKEDFRLRPVVFDARMPNPPDRLSDNHTPNGGAAIVRSPSPFL
jgi:hypothetical protein